MVRNILDLWFARNGLFRDHWVFPEPLNDRFPGRHSLLPVDRPAWHQAVLPETTSLLLGPLGHLAVRISEINSFHGGGTPYRTLPAVPQVAQTSRNLASPGVNLPSTGSRGIFGKLD